MPTGATGTCSPSRILLQDRPDREAAGSADVANTATLRNRDRGLLVAGIGLPALMNLLGRVEPDMAMRYLDVTLTELKRQFQLVRSQPQHLTPQPNPPVAQLRTGVAGAQHVQEMVRRTLPAGATRSSLDGASNRLTKIAEAKSAGTPFVLHKYLSRTTPFFLDKYLS